MQGIISHRIKLSWRLMMLTCPALPMLVTPAGSMAASVALGTYASTTAALNLRTGPGTSYAVRKLIPCGMEPYVLSGPYNTYWYKVRYAGLIGYVHLAQGSVVGTHLCQGAPAHSSAHPTGTTIDPS